MTDKAFFGKRSCVQTDSIGIEQKLRKLMCRDKTETAQTFNTFTYFGEVVSLEKRHRHTTLGYPETFLKTFLSTLLRK